MYLKKNGQPCIKLKSSCKTQENGKIINRVSHYLQVFYYLCENNIIGLITYFGQRKPQKVVLCGPTTVKPTET